MALPFRMVAGLPDRRNKRSRVLFLNDNDQMEWKGSDLGTRFFVSDYGAVGDGATDDRAAIQDAIDACEAAGGGTVQLTRGVYAVKQAVAGEPALTLGSNVTLEGYGAELDFATLNQVDTFNSVDDPCILAKGNTSEERVLSNTYAAGATSVVVTATAEPAYAVDDLILLTSTSTVDSQPIAELHRVKAVNSTTITLYEALGHAFEATAGKVYKVTPVVNVAVRGLTIRGGGREPSSDVYGTFGIIFQYCENVYVNDVRFLDCDQTALDFQSCIHFGCDRLFLKFSVPGTNTRSQYGVKISNASTHGTVMNCTCIGSKHAFVTGHTTAVPGFPRNVAFRDCTAVGTWHTGMITHKAASNVDFVRCKVYNGTVGINVRSKHGRVMDCVVQDATSGILVSELAEDIQVVGNDVTGATVAGINVTSFDSGHRPNNMVFVGNTVVSSAAGLNFLAPVDAQSPMTGWVIRGNHLTAGTGSSDRAINGAGNVSLLVTGNRLEARGSGAAMRIAGVQKTQVVGNYAVTAGTACLDVRDSGTAVVDHLVIRENYVEGGTVNAVYTALATGDNKSVGNNYIVDSGALDA